MISQRKWSITKADCAIGMTENVSSLWRQFPASFSQPLKPISVVLRGIAGTATRQHISGTGLTTFSNRNEMIPCCGRGRAIRTEPICLIQQLNSGKYRNRINIPFSRGGSFQSGFSVFFRGCISGPILGIGAFTTRAASDFIRCHPHLTTGTPRLAQRFHINSIFSGWAFSTIAAISAYISPAIKSGFIHFECIQRLVNKAFATPLFTSITTLNISWVSNSNILRHRGHNNFFHGDINDEY